MEKKSEGEGWDKIEQDRQEEKRQRKGWGVSIIHGSLSLKVPSPQGEKDIKPLYENVVYLTYTQLGFAGLKMFI